MAQGQQQPTTRVILVTGASRGIGLALCQALIERYKGGPHQGGPVLRVVGVGRSLVEEGEPGLASLLHDPHDECFEYLDQCDLGARDSAPSVVARILAACGPAGPWAIIHNAGRLDIGPLASADLESAMNVNVWGGMDLIQASLRLPQQGLRCVLLVSSGAATRPYRGWAGYCISKAALNMCAACLAVEYPAMISLAIRPGVVETRMQAQIREAIAPSSSGSSVMGVEAETKFMALHATGALLPPALPAKAMADWIMDRVWTVEGSFPVMDWNGRFVSWDALSAL